MKTALINNFSQEIEQEIIKLEKELSHTPFQRRKERIEAELEYYSNLKKVVQQQCLRFSLI